MTTSSPLVTEFAGVRFANPFIVAACPLTSDASHILAAAHLGWGGAVTKTITAHPQYSRNLTPALSFIKAKHEIVGLGNNEVRTHLGIRQWCENEIPRIKKEAPDFVLIGSVMEGVNPSDWNTTARTLEAAGVDMIEMNVSCAHGMPERWRGSYINDDPDLLEAVVSGCKANCSVPVIVKLNALCRDLGGAVRACVKGGADALAATNTLLALPSVDIRREVPNRPSSVSGESTVMGYSGTGIRPFGLHAISQMARNCALPLSGVGGIDTWENSVEYILLGATTVQVCTAAMIHGLSLIDNLKTGLCDYLLKHDAGGIRDLRGKALSSLVTPEEALNATTEASAAVDYNACTVCNKCIEPCTQAATAAISLRDGKILIDEQRCIGCGLCIAVCPFEAIEMKLPGQ